MAEVLVDCYFGEEFFHLDFCNLQDAADFVRAESLFCEFLAQEVSLEFDFRVNRCR